MSLSAHAAHLVDLMDKLDTEQDMAERAVGASELYLYMMKRVGPEVAEQRRQAVRALRDGGWTIKEVADLLGVTDARISQICGA